MIKGLDGGGCLELVMMVPCTRRGRRLSPRRCDNRQRVTDLTILCQLRRWKMAKRQGKEVVSKAGRGRPCLEKEATLLKPWFRTEFQCWETINLHCFKSLKL